MLLVRHGQTGATVRTIQVLLNNLTPIIPRLVEDGIFGPRTHGGVVQFQQKNALSADGIVGPRTGGAMLAVLRRRT